MIAIAIFNELSGRYLENRKTGDYLIFPSQIIAMGYINKMNLNPIKSVGSKWRSTECIWLLSVWDERAFVLFFGKKRWDIM